MIGSMLSLGILYWYRTPVLIRIGRWLDVGVEPRPADLVMILNGERNTRPFEAIDLVRRQKADRILITSSHDRKSAQEVPRVHEALQRVLTTCGIAADKIELLDSECSSTFDEAKALDEYLQNHPHTSMIIVTNDYHTRRARWVFRQVLGDRADQLQFVSAKTERFDARNWWRNEYGFVTYLAEFPKFAFYQFRYGQGLIWIGAAIAAVVAVGWQWNRQRIRQSSTAAAGQIISPSA